MKLLVPEKPVFFEAVAQPEHTMCFYPAIHCKAPQSSISGQQCPAPLLSNCEGKCVRRRENCALAANDDCTCQLRSIELLDNKSQRYKPFAELTLQLLVKKQVGHGKLIGQAEEVFEKPAPFQIDYH